MTVKQIQRFIINMACHDVSIVVYKPINHVAGDIINILPLVEGVTVDYHKKKK